MSLVANPNGWQTKRNWIKIAHSIQMQLVALCKKRQTHTVAWCVSEHWAN